MKFILVAFVSLLPAVAYSIGEAGDTEWPKGATVEVQLKLSGGVETNGYLKLSGDLLIKNQTDTSLTIQDPRNRLALAFVVFDPLGKPAAPVFQGKADPGFQTHTLAPRATYTHHFEGLDFVTGSAWLSYELSPGKAYKLTAVYRPAGPHGPRFTSMEAAHGTDYLNDKPANNPSWPQGMTNLVNLTNRVRGCSKDGRDVFFFSGDAIIFTAFLQDYSKVEGIQAHRLILHDGAGAAKAPWENDGLPCDWGLYGDGWFSGYAFLEAHFWTGGKIALDQVAIPKNIEVKKDK
jgi:hypothetical protein